MVYDPRSDIYSLGATLYELLTLRPAFDGRDRQVLLRRITQEEPIPPRRLDPAIPRDLETIVLKAMEKEPDRRYASAHELGEDLRRFLEDRTIRARRPNLAERAVKWARRHRVVLGTTAAVAFLAMAIATPLLWREQRKTARMYDTLRQTVEQADLGFEEMIRLSDELTFKGMGRFAQPGQYPGGDRVRSEFFRQAIEFYDHLVREPHTAKPMKALAYRRMGFARMMGLQDPRSADDFRRSLALYEELLAGSPRDPALRDAIGEVQMYVGISLMFTGRMDSAEAPFHQATSTGQGLVSEFPDDPGHLEKLTNRWLQIAAWMDTFGQRTEAERERRQLFAFYERLASDAAGSPGRVQTAVASYRRLARLLGDMEQRPYEQEALRRGLKLVPEDPALLNALAWSLALRPNASPGESAEAIELATRAVAANPQERDFRKTLGLAHLRAGHWPPAAEALAKSRELPSRGDDASDRLLLAILSWRRGDKEAALDWYIRALEDGLPRNPETGADVRALRAEAETLLGRPPAARSPPGKVSPASARPSSSLEHPRTGLTPVTSVVARPRNPSPSPAAAPRAGRESSRRVRRRWPSRCRCRRRASPVASGLP